MAPSPEARVLAAAFADDPLMAHIWPRSARRHRVLADFWETRIEARRRRGLVDISRDGEDVVAVALWEPPNVVAPLVEPVALLRTLGTAVPRAVRAIRLIDAARPQTPHLYLGAVGTLPEYQGRGYATALIRRRLAEFRADGFLVSNTVDTVPFYEGLGFRRDGEIAIGRGPTVFPMSYRPPTASDREPAAQ
ncbi:GNAT family N-acetyltransferase [Nocardia thraciensis]